MFSFSKKKKIKSKVVPKKVKEGGNDAMEPAEVKEEGNDVEPPHEAEVDESNHLEQREIVHAAIVHKEVFKENAKNASQHIPGKDDINDRQRIFSENRKRDSFINSKRLAAENDIFVEDLE